MRRERMEYMSSTDRCYYDKGCANFTNCYGICFDVPTAVGDMAHKEGLSTNRAARSDGLVFTRVRICDRFAEDTAWSAKHEVILSVLEASEIGPPVFVELDS